MSTFKDFKAVLISLKFLKEMVYVSLDFNRAPAFIIGIYKETIKKQSNRNLNSSEKNTLLCGGQMSTLTATLKKPNTDELIKDFEHFEELYTVLSFIVL